MKRKIVLLVATALTLGIPMVAPAGAGGGAHCEPDITDERTNVVTLAKNCFHPMIARVEPGDEVRFISEDPAPHTVTGAVYVFGDMEDVLEGEERTFRFDEEGIYPYVCIIHPGMAGAIVVGDGKGPGAGAVSDMTTYEANAPDTAVENEAAATAARTSTGTEWAVVIGALVALTALSIVSIRLRKRVAARTALTIHP